MSWNIYSKNHSDWGEVVTSLELKAHSDKIANQLEYGHVIIDGDTIVLDANNRIKVSDIVVKEATDYTDSKLNDLNFKGFVISDTQPTDLKDGLIWAKVEGVNGNIKYATLQVYNGVGFERVYLKTHANQIVETADRRFTSDAELINKVDKISGKQLSTEDYTTTEKAKLSNIEDDANNYIHPTTHDVSMITGLSDVATTGEYDDLANKPILGTASEKDIGKSVGQIPIIELDGKIDSNLIPEAPVQSVNNKIGFVVIDKLDIGLENVDNESKFTMFTNPEFTGVPLTPTATIETDSNQIANTNFVHRLIEFKTSFDQLLNGDGVTLNSVIEELEVKISDNSEWITFEL